ncbi:MAG: class I SAM-dependent methyltransferase [Alphaproteobacteria bacterium]|nr:class I SAM-dependent methyltransferase [Alphaproteobacteria bacterium]
MGLERCRGCGAGEIGVVLDFGATPIADRLATAEDPGADDPRAPLSLGACRGCGLVQLTEALDPALLFDDRYPYLSSVSATLNTEAEALAGRLVRELALGPDSRVLEIASNDGYLLRHFREAGIPVLGIDPAGPAVEAARERGIPTVQGFFDRAQAARLASEGERADLVIANNVLAHTPDIDGFLEGVATVMKPSGRAVFEVQWLYRLVAANAFDTIYHQHVFYFSLAALLPLLAAHGLTVIEAEPIAAQGGSLRVHAARGGEAGASVAEILELEAGAGLGAEPELDGFAGRVETTASQIRDLVREFTDAGHRVAGYGAAAKATTLLHACSLGAGEVSFIVDRNPVKQGKFMPGSRIPITAPERLRADPPAAVLLLAWNLADEILAQEKAYIEAGGRFILPLPQPRILP